MIIQEGWMEKVATSSEGKIQGSLTFVYLHRRLLETYAD